MAWGIAAAAKLSGTPMMFGSYPITPASSVLHALAPLKHFGVTTFQAEDEIAAVCSAIGASWAGAIGVTSTSGPGMALKTECMGLAVSVELPPSVVLQIAEAEISAKGDTVTSDKKKAAYGEKDQGDYLMNNKKK